MTVEEMVSEAEAVRVAQLRRLELFCRTPAGGPCVRCGGFVQHGSHRCARCNYTFCAGCGD
jgi:hypothetical protein